jgi:hypothetical protein
MLAQDRARAHVGATCAAATETGWAGTTTELCGRGFEVGLSGMAGW